MLARAFGARVPLAAVILGLAGLIPFAWGAATLISEPLYQFSAEALGPRSLGPYVQNFYGTIILAFMSGVLWGFATRAEGATAALGYGLSVIPALWAFFMVGGGAESSAIALIAGFAGLLGLDWIFWRHGLAPAWWMALRVPLSVGVILCLWVSLWPV